ncbi:MAG: PilZ domain-containing protein [Anaerolineales bacterium]
MHPERRAKKRIKISYYLPVNKAGSLEKLGILTEITTSGLQVDTQKLLNKGETYRLHLDLMNSNLGVSSVNFSATVRWTRPDPIEPNYFNIGMEIVDLSASERNIIEKIIAAYGSGVLT